METETIVVKGNFLALKKKGSWEYCSRVKGKGAVIIIAKTVDDEWLFVEQYRVPGDKTVIEFPAGLVGDEEETESLEHAAYRELLEETGYEAKWVGKLCAGFSSSGMSDEMQYFYLAHDCQKVTDKIGVGDEKLKLHVVPTKDIIKFIYKQEVQGKIVDPKIHLLFSTLA